MAPWSITFSERAGSVDKDSASFLLTAIAQKDDILPAQNFTDLRYLGV